MEMYSIIVAAITLYTGLFFVTGSHYTYMDNEGVSWFFLLFLAVPNIFFFLYWGYHMKFEILKLIYKLNRPKLFKFIACTKREKFYRLYLRDLELKA
jgi:hypothetical protein